MSEILKGSSVNILVRGATIAKSTSCAISITANTTEAASKDDADPYFDNPETTHISWEASNESFVSTIEDMKVLLNLWAAREPVIVRADATDYTTVGKAFITSVSITAANGEYATMKISFTGSGPFLPTDTSDDGSRPMGENPLLNH